MSSVFVNRGRDTREAARAIQKRQNFADDIFIEAHPGRCQIDRTRPLEGNLFIFEEHLVFRGDDYQDLPLVRLIEEVTLDKVSPTELKLSVPDVNHIARRAMVLTFRDMDRPDEAGRVIHFMKSKKLGKLDPRIKKALECLPIHSLYARALARYPQHHHDIFNLFELHSVLHLPEGRSGPIPDLPGDAALETGPIEAVFGHHIFYGCEVHALSPEGVLTGHFDQGAIAVMVDTELALYICSTCVCFMCATDDNFPIRLDFQGILAIVEIVVESEGQQLQPAIRISYISDDNIFNAFILFHFVNELAFDVCLHELTMAWALHHNRLYNVGEAFPLLDMQDLTTIVFHFRQLDKEGYGIIPKNVFLGAFSPLQIHMDTADLLYGMFDHAVQPDSSPEVVQFSRYLLAMRTLLCGPLEDKADLLFRAFDFQRHGWIVKCEQLYALAVMTFSLSPEVREGYTFQDFNKWMFDQFDKNRDGYISHQDFVEGICEDAKIRRAWTSLKLSPPPKRETRHRRRPGQRFIHAGHPRFSLVCSLQRGVETCVQRYLTRTIDPDDTPFEERQTYSMFKDNNLAEADVDWASSLPSPEWALPLESRVVIKNMEYETMYNGKSGSVIGCDPAGFAMIVNVYETGQPVHVSPENLTVLRTSLTKDILVNLQPGEDPGVCFQTKANGLPFVAGVTRDGPAESSGIYPGFVIDRINGYRMTTTRAIDSFMESWAQSGSNQLLYSIVLSLDDEHGIEVGARVEVAGLRNAPQYNGRRGVISLKDDLEAIQVTLDGEAEPVVLSANNIMPIGNSVHKKFKFVVPPTGELGMDLDITRPEGPIFVKSVIPHGPADRAGLPVKSIIASVNDIETATPGQLVAVVQEIAQSGTPVAVIEAIIPVGGRILPGEDLDDELRITDYAPEVFQDLRAMQGIGDEDYLHSIGLSSARAGLMTCHLRPFIEMRPGAMFYSTHDERFVITGLAQERAESLFKMLHDYREHLKSQRDSLIPKYVGLYCLEWHGSELYFAVTLNAFPAPHKDIQTVINVTPDEQIHKRIHLAPKAAKCLLIQLENDTRLLRQRRCIGYSVIIGVHSVRNEIEGDAIWGADKRLAAASTMLLGNPCFSRHEVVHSYNISRQLEPVFSRKHHTPLPPEKERHASAKRMIAARRRFFPEDAGHKHAPKSWNRLVMGAEERWLNFVYHKESGGAVSGKIAGKKPDSEEHAAEKEKENAAEGDAAKAEGGPPSVPIGKAAKKKQEAEEKAAAAAVAAMAERGSTTPNRVELPTIPQETPHLDSEWRCRGCGTVNAWRCTATTWRAPACRSCYRDLEEATGEPVPDTVPPRRRRVAGQRGTPDLFHLYRRTVKPMQQRHREVKMMSDTDKLFEQVASTSSESEDSAPPADEYHRSVARVRRGVKSFGSPAGGGGGGSGVPRMAPPKQRRYDAQNRKDPFYDPNNPAPPIAQHLCESDPSVPFEPQDGAYRTVFQRFFGGTPGSVIYPGDSVSTDEAAVQTDVLYFSLVDVLHPVPGFEIGTEVEYQRVFMECVKEVIIHERK